MDIFTHGLTGVALATAVSSHIQGNWKRNDWAISAGGFGGILPDTDVISMWSGFDGTFGKWFSLSQSGKDIFSDTHWYLHHVFTHSLVGAMTFSIIGCLIYLTYKKAISSKGISNLKWYVMAFFMGYLGHLVEDLITPRGPWGGIALFWPSKTFVGGWGKVWWWNNYDLFLIICSTITLNLFLLLAQYKSKLLTKLNLLTAVLLFIFQIERRSLNFNDHKGKETLSKELQVKYLGSPVYNVMKTIDDMVPVAL